MLQLRQRQIEPDVVVVEIAGQIILGRECQQVEWLIDELIGAGRTRIVFDLSDLSHVDSTGIGILVTSSGKVGAAGGELRLAALQPRIVALMKTTKLDRILRFYPTAAAAAENFNPAEQDTFGG